MSEQTTVQYFYLCNLNTCMWTNYISKYTNPCIYTCIPWKNYRSIYAYTCKHMNGQTTNLYMRTTVNKWAKELQIDVCVHVWTCEWTNNRPAAAHVAGDSGWWLNKSATGTKARYLRLPSSESTRKERPRTMLVCVCVCVCVYVCVCVCVWLGRNALSRYWFVCMLVFCMCVCVLVYVCECVHMCIYDCLFVICVFLRAKHKCLVHIDVCLLACSHVFICILVCAY
jgi:hypothetical protein